MTQQKIDIVQLRKNLEEMDAEYKPRLKGLKLVFGDPDMLQLRDSMEILAGMEREMKVKLDHMKVAQKLSEEIIAKKRSIIWLIGEIEKKQNANT